MVWSYALPPGVEKAIKHSGIPKNDLSIYIKEAGSGGRVIASLNDSVTRTPASVIKVLTTYAAVLELGFSYRWPTQFYTTGYVKNGVLHGDLIVKGFGDPTLDWEDVEQIATQIRQKGIRTITGNIVIDRSYFKVGTQNSSRFDEHPHSPYNAMPDAMMFNERISTICVTPNQNSVTKKYPDNSYIIHNQLQRVNKPCKGRYSWPQVKVDDSKAVPEVWLKGKISNRCGNRNICKVVTKPYKSFYYALKDALKTAGVTVKGTMRLQKVPSSAQILFTHYSEPLEKIIAKTAKKSNNLYARHLLLFLGAKRYGAPATLKKGRKAVMEILRQHHALGPGRLEIDNGSGLSRTAKLNAKILAALLDDAYERYGMRWMRTLSIAGVDGTIKRRFRGTVVKNRAWMKTGTLKRVKNIAGYVKSREGRYYTTVIIVNTKKGRWKAAKLEDDIIQWLVGYKGRGPKASSPSAPTHITITPTSAATHVEEGSKMYYVQAIRLTTPPSERFLSHIASFGLPYTVQQEGGYKVLIGPYAKESEARDILARVRKDINAHAFLLHRPKAESPSVY